MISQTRGVAVIRRFEVYDGVAGGTYLVPLDPYLDFFERGTTEWDVTWDELLRMRVRWINGEPNAEGPTGTVSQ